MFRKNIESAPSVETLLETLDAISNNTFDIDLNHSVIKKNQNNNLIIFYRKTGLIRGGRKHNQIYKNNDRNFANKAKKLCKTQKQNTKRRRNAINTS